MREQIFEARIDWNFSWEIIFAVFFSSGKTEEGNVIFSTFVTILGNTRDWKSIDLKFYLCIVSYCDTKGPTAFCRGKYQKRYFLPQ